jgi:Helitron helicase-like domain at N-terminus
MRMQQDGELELSDAALAALQSQSELGEVHDDLQYEEGSDDEEEEHNIVRPDVIAQPEMESGFSASDVYTFDKYPYLYVKAKDFMKLKQDGKIEIIEDHQQRVPIYNASASAAFPTLYLHGEKSPLDFSDYKTSRQLLKRQTLFAYKLDDNRYRWEYELDDVHLMWQYARLVERTVGANTCWYLQQRPDVAHLPMDQVVEAFKSGFTAQDGSLIDSKLPGLSTMMSQLPHSREFWWSQRMSVEAMSRDFGDPNLFLTLNNHPRENFDTRQLLHQLEYGSDAEFDPDWYIYDTEEFTTLMNKHAALMSIYLCRKAKLFLNAFLTDICGISAQEPSGDWTLRDSFAEGYYWSRVEFTSTRGVQHWHTLCKLPHVLDTAVIGRMIQNGRVVRLELKTGNIKDTKVEAAWEIVEAGLLANRYATLFADGISTASFYTETMDVDSHDETKVIDIDKLRKDISDAFKEQHITTKTHPLMRRFYIIPHIT